MFQKEIEEKKVEQTLEMIKNAVDIIYYNSNIYALLSKFGSVNKSLYGYSLKAAVLCGLMTLEKEWVLTSTIQRLVLAGLFHDIGKINFPEDLLYENIESIPKENKSDLIEHPLISGQMLNELGFIPKDVIQIIEQHHEKPNGSGYPQGLSRKRIHPLVHVLSVAVEFCRLTSHKKLALGPSEALTMMENYDDGEVFDRDNIKVLRNIFSNKSQGNRKISIGLGRLKN